MTARNFLIRGLLAGLIAGALTFIVGNVFGEPAIDDAISIEEASSAAQPTEETTGESADEPQAAEDGHTDTHSHGDGEGGWNAEVSRGTQKTWGLGTATLAVGAALGGIVALVSAGVVGRLGRMSPAQSTALVGLVGFVSVSLVPFLKYPATPPAVGNEDTIGERTGYYFLFMLVSVVAAIGAVALGNYLFRVMRPLEAIAIAGVVYVAVVVGVGYLLPTVNEIGDFPGDLLWYFRRGSLLTLATLWVSVTVVLTGLVGRLFDREVATAARREFAASL